MNLSAHLQSTPACTFQTACFHAGAAISNRATSCKDRCKRSHAYRGHHNRGGEGARTASVPCTAVAAGVAGGKPSTAETARTIVEVMSHGTLCTLNEDGTPLGTYTSYMLDDSGHPLLRLRADAVHKANLLREPRCSLFVQPQDMPARLLARVTLIGKAEPVDAATSEQAAELHRKMAGGSVGVDAPQATDHFFRLAIHRCFYVGGMGSNAQAEDISQEDFRSAAPDVLRDEAPSLVEFFNQERTEDVMRIAAHAAGAALEQIYAAELLWVDRMGAYVAAEKYGSERKIYRVRFQRPVMDHRDARSVLTLLAQYAWEQERNYSPPIPEAIAS